MSAAAAEAAQVRELTTRPDVVALQVDRVRAQVDALLWAGIVLGLLFTTVNVQQFAAAGAPVFSPGWWIAWLLDPIVSLVLLAVLRAEQVAARYQVSLGVWPKRTKWSAFAATYVMNTWTSWGLDGGRLSVSGVILHSVPPLLVVLSAETGPVLRDRLTEAARRAVAPGGISRAHERQSDAGSTSDPAVADVLANGFMHDGTAAHEPLAAAVHVPSAGVHERPGGEREVRQPQVAGEPPHAGSATEHRPGREGRRGRERRPARRRTAPSASRVGQRTPVRRRLLADFLQEARTALAQAAASDVRPDPTPIWCREVTGCSAGTSVKLAAALRAEHTGAPGGDVDGRRPPNGGTAERQEALRPGAAGRPQKLWPGSSEPTRVRLRPGQRPRS